MFGYTIIQAADISPVEHGIAVEPVMAKENGNIIRFVKIETF
jgi:hypothetical protein